MPNRPGTGPIARYVALGDSYTIGTSVRQEERFPDQLVASLGPGGPRLRLVGNLGVNGYTSADLIRDELPAVAGLAPDFVTVLIGVNDVVQGVPLATYEANVATILAALLAQLPADSLVTVGIPDYTVTPAGRDYGDPETKRAAIVAANEAMARSVGGALDPVRRHLRSLAARCARTGRLSRPTGCIRRGPNTPSGSSGSGRSSRRC